MWMEVNRMSDLISRQAAIRWVKTECNPYGNPTLDFESGKKVIAHLEQMPSAQPQWIPVTERLPEEDGEYITTVEDGEGMFVTSDYWRQDLKQWGFWSVDEEYDEVWRRVTNVVAWMKLPEPWRA